MGKWQKRENIKHMGANRSALSKKVNTMLQRTYETTKLKQKWRINNKKDPQKKHRLETVSK